MKIALYAGTYVKDKDGAVRTIYQLVSSLRKGGHTVVVWSPDVSSADDYDGMTVHRMPSVPIPLYPDYRLGFFTEETRRQLDILAPDIIHISTPDLIGRKFLLYAKKHSIPVGSAYHTDFPSYLQYYRLGFAENALWKYFCWFYNTCDIVLVPSESMRHRLEARRISNVEIWSRGIDKGLFDPSRRSLELRKKWDASERTVFVYAGRFVHYKDIEIVMQVYERFMQDGYRDRVRFVMIGSGPAEDEMRARMPEAVFTGYLTGLDLPEAYASGDVFLFPSTTETFCNVTLEAFASGLPCVVSDIGGCGELVDKSGAGFVVKAGDADAFYRNCLEIIGERDRFLDMRLKGLVFSESKSWTAINNALITRYIELKQTKSAK
ncbi:MAG: glycosyltransferase family 1 protein [Chlorobiaceae bacterium]|nr:glycosyltransferase family 1 protein [Chlorobiaceae bacterium]NTV59677.1 glycosyltransferase family 1 protein [Chlorobiaceae bacterium]